MSASIQISSEKVASEPAEAAPAESAPAESAPVEVEPAEAAPVEVEPAEAAPACCAIFAALRARSTCGLCDAAIEPTIVDLLDMDDEEPQLSMALFGFCMTNMGAALAALVETNPDLGVRDSFWPVNIRFLSKAILPNNPGQPVCVRQPDGSFGRKNSLHTCLVSWTENEHRRVIVDPTYTSPIERDGKLGWGMYKLWPYLTALARLYDSPVNVQIEFTPPGHVSFLMFGVLETRTMERW
jgi:hypothetical protein